LNLLATVSLGMARNAPVPMMARFLEDFAEIAV
jgi:hypothetical protein